MNTLTNPVLRGFYPDPSVCCKGKDYYLVTSTFEFFPAVPVFHSRDLASWEQVGFCVSEPGIIDLNGARPGKGIYAPTIRYNPYDGYFYMITVLCHNDRYEDNEIFYVRAKDPAGPWSGKFVVSDAEGIDPSLFFEDGKAYYVGNLRPDKDPSSIRRYIWMDEIDLETGKLAGKRTILLKDGAVYGAKCPEGPHIYRFGDYYYLLIAEGGTALNHATSVFRSRSIWGPYENNPRNPILTHRNQAKTSRFNSIGHADIFQGPDGSFWTCLLGVRPYCDPDLRNIGRETFIAPVIWEDGWPVFCPDTGKVEETYSMPWKTRRLPKPSFSSFRSGSLESFWQSLRTPSEPVYRLTGKGLELRINKYTLQDNYASAFLGRRQQEEVFAAETAFDFTPRSEKEQAGVIVMLHNKAYYALQKTIRNGEEILVLSDYEKEIYSRKAPKGTVRVRMMASGLDYWFELEANGKWKRFGPVLDGRQLSKLDKGFTGVLMGLYGTSNGEESDSKALFHYFSYQDWE